MTTNAAGRRVRKRKLKADINVVPYIDVMLVLLIIFMVTAPLLNLGTDIKLPDSRARALQTPQDPVVVSIYADGAYALMIEKNNQSLTGADLTARLGAINRQHDNDLLVLVNGDR
ncbi:MAG: biopolymer transporter ExbD, partial [Luteimonas sp.]